MMGVSNSKGFMFDRIKIQQNGNFLNLNHNHLDNCNEKVSKNGNPYYEGYLKGLKVIFGSGQLSINGSWPKFKYGENITELNLSTTGEVIKEISDLLSIDISSFHITQLEFGTNIFTDYRPQEYILRLGNKRYYKRSQYRDTLSYENINNDMWRQLIFYDKALQAFKCDEMPNKYKGANILRYEMKFRGLLQRQLRTGTEVTPELLTDPKFFLSMKNRIKQEYNSIGKRSLIEDDILSKVQTPLDGMEAVWRRLISKIGIEEYNEAVEWVKNGSKFNKKQLDRFKAKARSYTVTPGTNTDPIVQELDCKISSI